VLGAGFSAYAGLPVMSNFIDKAKDICFSDNVSDCKKDIELVLQLINRYSNLKNYMASNLFNIEELLSIAEMKNFVDSEKSKNIIKPFIKAVIQYYEYQFFKDIKITANSNPLLIPEESANQYLLFLYALFNISFRTIYPLRVSCMESDVKYGLITFNYDTILEHLCSLINTGAYTNSPEILFNATVSDNTLVRYCKLHGSIDKDNIIPPTWSKFFNNDLKKEWQDAYSLLKEANDIRIIGFSFPETDSHISYLFKTAIMENQNLKNIDVLCLDDNNSTIEKKYKYKSKFETDKLRF
jgi:hypothetical protein